MSTEVNSNSMTVLLDCDTNADNSTQSAEGCCKLREKILRRGRTGRASNSSRGSKKNGNALKFHNFVANQSVASTRITATHCLREEHGTKQITVSHWRKPVVQNGSTLVAPIKAESIRQESQKQSILESLLAKQKHDVETSEILDRKVNKRKPLLIRRVMRKDEIGEQNEPLDLSVKKKPEIEMSLRRSDKNKSVSVIESNTDSIDNLIKKVEQSAAEAALIMASVSGSQQKRSPVLLSKEQRTFEIQRSMRPIQPKPMNAQQTGFNSANNAITVPYMYQIEQSPQKHCKQRNTQRGVIKQKLEETFRQNGFLVKTKQVSDGDATFCKFRQLRKYTRYYLKSWHQHLPDEVNKLWKGFLPPKSAKPSSSHNL